LANIKSAKKRMKVIAKKTLKNQSFKSLMKTTIKKYEAAVKDASNKELMKETYRAAIKKVDQAASRGVIHKNKAARQKSQFTKKLNAI